MSVDVPARSAQVLPAPPIRLSPPAPPPMPAAPAVRPREGFLDVLRAIALVRVVIWHAFGTALISWCVAAMPAMFFVAGSLLAASLDRKPWRELLPGRLRRLLVPFWVFSGTVLTVLAIVQRMHPTSDMSLHPWQVLSWLIPLTDPQGPTWTGGWVSDPLWYLRCYLWLLLLAPLLRRAHRRFGLFTAIPPLVMIFVVDALIRAPSTLGWFRPIQWYAGDLATYSVFLLLGFSHRDGVFRRIDARGRAEWGLIAAIGALLWVHLVSVPGLVVNDSYPLLLFVGSAWLGVFLAAENRLTAAAAHRFIRPVVNWLGRRAISLYLWHPVAIVGAYWLRAQFLPQSPQVAVLVLVVPLVLTLVVLFGRVEDLAAGRTGEWWPGRPDPEFGVLGRVLGRGFGVLERRSPVPLLAAGLALGCIGVSFVAPGPLTQATSGTTNTGGLALPPAPSGKPKVADFGAAVPATSAAATPSGTATPAAGATTGATTSGSGMGRVLPGEPIAAGAATGQPASAEVTARIEAAVLKWRTAKSVDGVRLGVLLADGSVAQVVSGKGAAGETLAAADPVPITSLTKSMTAAIILQLVAEGKIGLDDPLPDLTARPGLPWVGKVTIRQLLNHTAGVKPYDKTSGYEAVKTGPLTPITALDLVAKDPTPLEWTPGTGNGYSNSGYLTLGLLAEQLSGSTYAELLKTRVFDKAGMTASTLDEVPSAGWIGFSAGGVLAPIADLLDWGNALYRAQTILPKEQLAAMTDITNDFSAGLGAFPACPCGLEDGVRVYTSIGHNGGQTSVEFSPADHLVIAVWLSESMWVGTPNQEDMYALQAAVRVAVAG
jgi:CubicO group peptidase (beta-lactamase class C family)/peptidoglycan/LPS O-acetylase OafA/YrhL